MGNIKDNEFENKSIIVFFLSMIANVMGVIFQSLSGHLLEDISLFADLNSVMALFNILVLPTTIASCTIAKYSSELSVRGEYGQIKSLLKKAIFLLSLGVIIFSLIMMVFKKNIALWLHIEDLNVVGAAIILAGVTLISAVFTGGLQGMQLFVLYGIFGLIGPIFKIVAVVISTVFEHKLLSILYVWLLGSIVSYFIGGGLIHNFLKKYPRQAIDIKKKTVFHYMLKLLMANIGLSIIMNIDILLVKHNFNSEAGLYSAALMIGKIVTYVTGALVTVIFPMVAGGKNSDRENFHLLKKAIMYNLILGITIIFFINMFSGLVIRILLGTSFLECSNYLLMISIYILPQSILNLLGTYRMAQNKMKFFTITLGMGCVAEVISSLVLTEALAQFIWCTIVIMWLLVFLNLVYISKENEI